CLGGSFGPDCGLSCDDCMNGAVCSADRDRCDCTPGWTGTTCNQTCPQGAYGQACSGLCRCQNGGSCDPGTGSCVCPTGVQGLLCEDGCPSGHFGRLCLRKCNCPNNGHCHRVFGSCLCSPGLYGRFCHLPLQDIYEYESRWTSRVGRYFGVTPRDGYVHGETIKNSGPGDGLVHTCP
ncbi:unnamed protein product, partial [Arctogadus glacialis]